ncbi:hypothetical protein BDR05DRAFT_1005672 [Suillus weaverae]|nr:hypothetical protein BDR05DRAFT_1005672 [Suillus weaverae]
MAPASAISPVIATAVPPNPATSASTSIGQKLKALLRTAIKGVMIALRAILHAGLHAAKKFAAIFGWVHGSWTFSRIAMAHGLMEGRGESGLATLPCESEPTMGGGECELTTGWLFRLMSPPEDY